LAEASRDIRGGSHVIAIAGRCPAQPVVVWRHGELRAGSYREEASIARALAVAGRFGIKVPAAKSILREVFTAVAGWRRTARRLRLKGATMEAYASAFEHELMDEARRLLAQ
jgi:hypothetical protein